MAWHFALMIDPADVDDTRSDFAATFTEVDPAAPALTVGELSTQRGDGIFESIGVIDGHPQEVEAHLSRLAHSAQLCDLPVPHAEQWRQAVALAASACGAGEAVIKLILSRGIEHGPTPTAWVTAAPAADFSIARSRGIRVVGTALAIMGVMLACVGIFPVNVNMLLHNLSASGMALMFLLLLVGGPWIVRRMPRAYFLASWAFLAGLVASIALFATGYFGLTAFEIIVFALIFGWLAVFIRFMVVADQPDPRG